MEVKCYKNEEIECKGSCADWSYWDGRCSRCRNRVRAAKELKEKLLVLAPSNAEALVYITGKEKACSWYNYYTDVTIELMLNKSIVKHTTSIYPPINNSVGGWDVTGAAIAAREDAADVCRELFSVVVEEESFLSL